MTGLILPRRKFLTGLAALFCAPAIVRAESLMKIAAIKPELYVFGDVSTKVITPESLASLIPYIHAEYYSESPIITMIRQMEAGA